MPAFADLTDPQVRLARRPIGLPAPRRLVFHDRTGVRAGRRRRARQDAGHLKDGRMKSREDMVRGLDQFPGALLALFSGGNFGKLVLSLE